MNTKNNQTRCWVTGVEIKRSEGYLLNRELICRLRDECAQKLAILEYLLNEFGPRAGDSSRGQKLGIPPYAPRMVSPMIARLYEVQFPDQKIFLSFHDASQLVLESWKEDVLRDKRIAARFAGLDEEEWSRMYRSAQGFKIGLPPDLRITASRYHIDACVALILPQKAKTSLAAMDEWLASKEAELIVDEAQIPKERHDAAYDILSRRCDAARKKINRKSAGIDNNSKSVLKD